MKHHYAPADMGTETAEKVAAILQERLSSLIDLSMILKHVHWNVVGMGFIAMHELMDDQARTVRGPGRSGDRSMWSLRESRRSVEWQPGWPGR